MKNKLVVFLVLLSLLAGCSKASNEKQLTDILDPVRDKTFANLSTVPSEDYEEDLSIEELDLVDIISFDSDLNFSYIYWKGSYNDDDGFFTTSTLREKNYSNSNLKLEERFEVISGTTFFTEIGLGNSLSDIFTVYKVHELEDTVEIRQYVLGKLLDKSPYKHGINIENIYDYADELNEVNLDNKELFTYEEIGDSKHFKVQKSVFIDDVKIQELKVGLNIPFNFRGIKYTIGDVNGWTKVSNRFSDLDGRDIFKVPVHFENNTDKPDGLNMFSYTVYGPSGAKLSSVSSYVEGEIDYFGDILPGASADSYFAVLYEGDGEYQIHFNDFGDGIIIKFTVSK